MTRPGKKRSLLYRMFFKNPVQREQISNTQQAQIQTDTYICTQCGERFSQPKKFCAKCGSKLES